MNHGRPPALPRSASTLSTTSTGASTDNESLFGNDIEDDDKDKFKRSVQSYGEEGRSTETFSLQHTPSRKIRNLSEKKRRDQFNMLINELCSMVSTNNRKMDKSTVLKSTIAFLKNYQELAMQSQAHEIKEDWKPSFLSNDEFTQLMLEALDSFLLVFTQQGKILYASESITSLLGHLSSDLINRSLYDLIHESEQLSLHNLLHSYQVVPGNEIPDFEKEENQISFMCHLKRGAMKPVETDVYEYVKVTGSFRKCTENILQLEENSGKFTKDFKESSNESTCFCCTIQLQPCQLIREMSFVDETKPEFSSRHSFEWKFLFLDYRAPPIIGYLPFEVLGTSGYDYYHPDDLDSLAKCHEQLMQAGEGTSCFYRFLTKGQQWIWLKTRYYITYHQWNSKPEFIVCTHTVVSYANVQSHGQKNHRYTDEEVEAGTLDSAQSEKSCHSSVCCHQSSPTYASWSSQLQTTQVALTLGKTSRQLRASEDQADTTEKPHSTLDEVSATVKTVLKNSQLQTKQQASASPQFSQHQCVQQEIPQQKQILAFPSSMMMMMAASPCNIPTSNQESVQISTIGQQSVAVPSLTLPQTIYQPPSTIFPRFYMTPAQQQLHEQLKHKSQQLQQTILRQQEELQKITEELSLAQQGFLPGAQMLMINPSSFQTNNAEVHSSSPTSQFNVLQQQFLPLHLLAASNGQVLQQSPSSSSSATHP